MVSLSGLVEKSKLSIGVLVWFAGENRLGVGVPVWLWMNTGCAVVSQCGLLMRKVKRWCPRVAC